MVSTTRFSRIAVTVMGVVAASSCAAPATVPATEQPALARMAAPYADDLRNVGIDRLMVYPDHALVRVTTRVGEIYFRYPAELAPTGFALYVGAGDVKVDSDGFNAGNPAQYEAAMKAVLPEAVRQANVQNIQEAQRRVRGG